MGDPLPFQGIFKGKTSELLPSLDAPGMDRAKSHGMVFTPAKSNSGSYFATLHSMKIWVLEILEPWRRRVVEEDNLPEDQKMISYIDIYPVHTSVPFRSFVFADAPHVILIYVPGGCTGIAQPCDVGLNRVIKHFLKQEFQAWLAQHVRDQIAAGVAPPDVRFPKHIGPLRDASVTRVLSIKK